MNRLELPNRTLRWADQFEMPLDGVRWMVDAIEQVLERKPSEGGAPRGVLHADGEIRGERLRVRLGGSVSGEGVAGYTVSNWDRREYIITYSEQSQEFSITKDLWDERLRDLYKQIAARVATGELYPKDS